MRHSALLFIALTLATAILTSCQHRESKTSYVPQQEESNQRPKLLVIDPSKPIGDAWRIVDGKKVSVIPMGAFTGATISHDVRAEIDHALTGDIIITPQQKLWAIPGGQKHEGSQHVFCR